MQTTSYTKEFYDEQAPASYRSAVLFSRHLWTLTQPQSVVDFGCGKGTWLKAFKQLGAQRLTGYDGPWISQEMMADRAIRLIRTDLNEPIECDERFDLAISLEVAEHLRQETADIFVRSLTDASDLVLFGAAVPGQGGTDHINEQLPSYWATKFISLGYQPFDIFRLAFWKNSSVKFWYRQNTFLYARTTSSIFTEFLQGGYMALPNIAFMDCIHPELHELTILRGRTGHKIRNIVRPFFPTAMLKAIARWREKKHS